MASAIIITLTVAALFICSSKEQYLLLTNELSGQVLFCVTADQGSEFAVSFNHSVNKSPVIEYYRIENGLIYLKSLRYYTFGAGMPTELLQGQTMRHEEDGAMVIEGFDRPIPHLVYNIGRISNHTLHWQGREIPLNTLDAPGQPILFSLIVYPRLWPTLHGYTTRAISP